MSRATNANYLLLKTSVNTAGRTAVRTSVSTAGRTAVRIDVMVPQNTRMSRATITQIID